MALISNVIKPVFKNVINSIYDGVSRFVYNFDGVDDRGSLQFRAINPDGNNTFEIVTPEFATASNQSIISQSISSSVSSREFDLFFSTSGNLLLVRGGTQTTLFSVAQGVKTGTRYGITQTGDFFQIFEGGLNGPRVRTVTALSGSAREPSAQTVIGCRPNGSGGFTNFFQGTLHNVKINDVSWPIADRNQSIQLPQPSGLGAELITPTVLENPVVKGSQWSYLGDGRWQLVGDGNINTLEFFAASGVNQPIAGYLEFEIESISGQLTCVVSASGTDSPAIFNTIGVKRYYYTKQGNTGNPTNGNLIQFKRLTGVVSCIIKNISFKPLLTTGASLVSNGDFAAVGTWVVGANSVITNGELQINVASSTVTRQPIATDDSKDYLITYTVKSITSGAVRVLLYGNGVHFIGSDRTVAGTYTEIARFNRIGGSFPNSVTVQAGHTSATNVVVDNISVLEITSLCNPLLLTNTTSDRWQEIVE